MNCEQMNELLSAWLDGEATPEEEKAMQEHLDGCPECRELFAQLQGLHTSFSDLEMDAPEGFARRVMDRIREESKPKLVPLRKNRRWKSLTALAACALLAVGVGRVGMGGGASAPETAAAPGMEMAMDMAPETKANFAPEAPASAPAAQAPEPGARAEHDVFTASELPAELEKDGREDTLSGAAEAEIIQTICVTELPEGLEEAVGPLVWEEREDGSLCAVLNEEQAGLVLQLALDQGLSVEHSVADAREPGEGLLVLLPQ